MVYMWVYGLYLNLEFIFGFMVYIWVYGLYLGLGFIDQVLGLVFKSWDKVYYIGVRFIYYLSDIKYTLYLKGFYLYEVKKCLTYLIYVR